MNPYIYLGALAALAFGRLILDLTTRAQQSAALLDGQVVFDIVMIGVLAVFMLAARLTVEPLVVRLKRVGPHLLVRASPSLKSALSELGEFDPGSEPRPARLRIGVVLAEGHVEFWTRATTPHRILAGDRVLEATVRERGVGRRLFPSVLVKLADHRTIELVVLDSVIRVLPVGVRASRRAASMLNECRVQPDASSARSLTSSARRVDIREDPGSSWSGQELRRPVDGDDE